MVMTASAVMTPDVVTVSPDDSWLAAVRKISEHHVHALPVVDPDRRVVGIISESDLMAREERLDPGHGWNGLPRPRDARRSRAMTVHEAMTRRCVTIAPDTPLGEAARTMHRRRVGRLPVVDADRRLVGIVTRSDLLSVFLRDDADLEQEVRDALQSGGAVARGVEACVRDAVVELTGTTRYRTEADVMRRTAMQVPGVVDVNSRLAWDVDDVYTAAGGI